MKLRVLWAVAGVWMAWVACACSEEQGAPPLEPEPARMRTTRHEANSVRKVLILGSTVSGGLQSQEARAVAAMPPNPTLFEVEVVAPAQWKAMTAEQFMSYRALVIGDAACTQGTAAWQAALDTRDTWGAIVDGNIVAIGTNLATNSWSEQAGEIDPIMKSALEMATLAPYRTGLYVSLGCAYQNSAPGTPVELLSPFGTFTVAGNVPCVQDPEFAQAHIPIQYPESYMNQNEVAGFMLTGIDGCAAKSVFIDYPENDFSITALMRDLDGTMPGANVYHEFDLGADISATPIILTRGATAVGLGCGGDSDHIPPGEECDIGDNGNGLPAPVPVLGPPPPSCSWSCKSHWCGDGIVQAELGEQCDQGSNNGRDIVNGGIIANGMCSRMCRIVDIPTGSPPTVQCKNVTVAATTNTCGASASINDGSFDVDGDLVGCTQNPAGPFNLGGPQNVTLTCTDQKNHVASKTCTVTVTDGAAPVITLTGSSATLQCGVDTYTEQRATVADECPADGQTDVTANLVITNPMTSTAPAKPVGNYNVLYNAKDKAGNSAAQVTRSVTVNDTLKPTITLAAPVNQTVECNATANYVDPGASGTDLCVGSLTSAIVKGGTANPRVPGSYSITYDVQDPSGNAADRMTRLITVQDKTSPVLSVAPYNNVILECGAPFEDKPISITDSCYTNGPFTAPVPSRTVNMRLLGSQAVTYTAKDPANNTGASSPRTFNIQDTLQPTLTLLGASPMAVECGDPFTNPGATANDQCSGDLTSVISKTGSVNPNVPGPYTLGYSVTDGRTTAVTANRPVTVQDTLKPVVTMNGSSTVAVECGDPAYADQGASATDKCAGPLPVVANPVVNPKNTGTYNVTYSATDPSGNTGTSAGSRTVTVQDTLPPVLNLNGPASSGLECGTPFTDPGASASDQCAGTLTPVVLGSVNHMQPNSYTLRYTATDPSGKSASATRTVAVSDTIAPQVTMTGASTAQVECGTGPFSDPGGTATDSCFTGQLTVVPTVVVNPNSPGSYTIQYKATDPSGNTGTAAGSRTVTVKDTQEPVLSLNGAATQTLECATAYNELGATASDVCKGNLPVTTTGGVNNMAVGPYSLEYSATDGVFTKKVNRTVTVQDTLAPDITLLGSANDSLECGSTYVDPGATASDACAGNVTSRLTSQQVPNPGSPGSFTITYSVTDGNGNSRTLTGARTVTVSDNKPPVLVRNGAATVSQECGFQYTDDGATANDVCDGNLTNSIVTVNPVATGTPGNYTVRYNVKDKAGLSAPEVIRAVSVSDTLPPELTVNGPLSQVLECGNGTYQDPGASATDKCSATVTVTPSTVVDQNAPGAYTITYTAKDPTGNSVTSNVSRSVTVQDTLPPSITLNPGDTGVECGTPYTDPGATASDLCKGALPVATTGSVNHLVPGSYPLGYSATDGKTTVTATRTVGVSDTLFPTITVLGSPTTTFECGSTYVDEGATASDVCSGNLTSAIVAVPTGDPSQPGTFNITYKVKDGAGNETVAANARTVTVNDNAPPVLVLNGPATLGLECAVGTYTEQGARADDACFGDVTNRVQIGGAAVNAGATGTYVRTYNVTDPAGKSAPQLTRTVTVSDTLLPSITVQGALTRTFECGTGPYTDPGATASDLCAGDLTGSVVTTGAVLPGTAGQYTLSYSVTDPSGNKFTSGQTRTVNVQDTLPPSIALTGAATVGLECGTSYNELGATANDACAGNLTVDIAGTVNTGAVGGYTRTYTAADPSGHNAQTTRQVNVSDTLAPTLTLVGPAAQLVECKGQYADPGAQASDQCAGDLTAAIVKGGSVDPAVLGPYTVTYDVADPSGHPAPQVSRAVTVRDSLPPSLTVNGPLSQQHECGSTYTDPGAVANDQCAGDLTAAIVATPSGGNPNAPGSFSISYKVKDPSGNEVTSPVTRTVSVSDNFPPTLALTGPATVGVECRSAYNELGATASDACFGDLTSAIVKNSTVNTAKPGQYAVAYNVTDPAGQSAPTVSRGVNVNDTLPPSLTVVGPTNATYQCGSTYQDPGATASDVCAGDLTAKVVPTSTPVPGQPGTVSISYSVTDPSGNTTTSATSRTVRMIDEVAPVVTLLGASSENKECGTPYADPGATATDQCVGNLSVTVTGAVDHTTAGTYVLTYTATDLVGNTDTETRTVRISDTQGPVITVNGPSPQIVECNPAATWADPGAVANDICSGVENVTVVGSVNPAVPTGYTVRYEAVDNSGNAALPVIRNVLVQDNLPPTITLNGPNPMILECALDNLDDDLLATVVDQCYGDTSHTVIRERTNLNINAVGEYFIRYQGDDTVGHVVQIDRTVQVRDTTAPVLTVQSPSETIECGTQPSLGVTATDACYGPVAVIANPASVPSQAGQYTVTYTAVDPAGNVADGSGSVTRTITVEDTTAPTVTLVGQASQIIECGQAYFEQGATAEDACGGEGITDVSGTVNSAVAGAYTLTYSARDSSGNTSLTVTRTVTVKDSQPPSIECPPARTIQADSDGFATVTLESATAEDSCSEAVVSGPSERRFQVGTHTVTYVAKDASGNEASCTSTVIVEELPPAEEEEWDQAFLGSGNGCSATGGESSLSMVGFLALLARLARKRHQQVLRGQFSGTRFMTARWLVLAVLLASAAAFAQSPALPEFELERLKLNPNGLGSLLIGTGELLPEHAYRFALTTHYENDPLVLYQNGTPRGVVVRHRATAHLSVAYGLWKRLELGAQVPLVLLQRGDDLSALHVGSPRQGMSLGTPQLSARLRLLSERDEDAVDLSVGILAEPRIGQSGSLTRELRGLPSVMVGRRFGFLRGGLDAGLFMRPRTILSKDAKIQDELGHALRLGAMLATTGRELSGELAVIASVPFKREGYSVETLAGMRLPLSASIEAYGLAGLGYGNAPGTPDFRVLLGVAHGQTPPAPVAVEQQAPPALPVLVVKEHPEPPRDEDEVPDEDDACPDEDGIVEMRGCPPKDSDGDTVWDHQDNCPSEPGPTDNQGCPVTEKQLVAIQKDRIEIRDTVYFDFDKATIQPRSFPLLDQVARVLLEHPEIVAVTIEGHTDARGSAEYNRDLSQRRAEAVRDYFVQKGVASERMKALGFGEDRPLRSNDTDEGRAANRRVEFITRYAQ
jgi:fimbrial isopeptide formation D2 family protein